MVRVRQLAVDEHFSLRGKTLEESIRADKEKGLIPFLVCYLLIYIFIYAERFYILGFGYIRNNILLFI